MKNGMVIIDADGHAVDNEAVYRERLPERYRKRNFIVSSDGFDRGQNGTIMKQPKDSAQNLADNDREGIDLQIIYPTGGLFLSRVREPDYATALFARGTARQLKGDASGAADIAEARKINPNVGR